MKRKLSALTCCLLLLAAMSTSGLLSGCGGNDTTNNATNSPGNKQSGDEHAGHDHSEKSNAGSAANGGSADNHDAKAHTHGTKLTVTTEPVKLQAGKKAQWNLFITDDADKPVENFEIVHEKPLHLIVVSKDLEWFNHQHPQYSGGGKFTISTMVPRAGRYKLFADYKPEGGEADVASHEFSVDGANPRPSKSQLKPDAMQGVWLVKRVTAAPEENLDARGGAAYTVKLMPMPMKLKAGEAAMMHFQVGDANGKLLADIEPYLGALGHCVILSQDAETYLHTHPGDGEHDHEAKSTETSDASESGDAHEGHNHVAKPVEKGVQKGGPDVVFHAKFPRAGLYKVWGQFRHKGRIITAPFVVQVS